MSFFCHLVCGKTEGQSSLLFMYMLPILKLVILVKINNPSDLKTLVN